MVMLGTYVMESLGFDSIAWLFVKFNSVLNLKFPVSYLLNIFLSLWD
jgi:hypothetical protein